jgi:hypothetical protein
MGWHFSQIFNLMTIPALIASVTVYTMGCAYAKKTAAPLVLNATAPAADATGI